MLNISHNLLNYNTKDLFRDIYINNATQNVITNRIKMSSIGNHEK